MNQIGEEFYETVRQCRKMVRKGGLLFQLVQAERPDQIDFTSRPTDHQDNGSAEIP